MYYVKLCDCKDEKDKVSAFEGSPSFKEDMHIASTDVGILFLNKIVKEGQINKIKSGVQNHS